MHFGLAGTAIYRTIQRRYNGSRGRILNGRPCGVPGSDAKRAGTQLLPGGGLPVLHTNPRRQYFT
jgi:hypothetical protein